MFTSIPISVLTDNALHILRELLDNPKAHRFSHRYNAAIQQNLTDIDNELVRRKERRAQGLDY